MKKFLIIPSILSANFAKLGDEIKEVLYAGGDVIHFDVMDNHYVPNLTIGPMVLKSIREYNIDVQIDVHLMTQPVDNLIPIFAENGANFITFHPEATHHIDRTLTLIKSYGCKAGLALSPATSLGFLDYVMDKLDIILIMSVNPGFGNQSFIYTMLEKIKEVRRRIDASMCSILLEVDGGIKVENIIDVAIAGANAFVIGSAIFKSVNYKETIIKIRKKLNKLNYNFIH